MLGLESCALLRGTCALTFNGHPLGAYNQAVEQGGLLGAGLAMPVAEDSGSCLRWESLPTTRWEFIGGAIPSGFGEIR